jgi:hypothetical protein
MVRSLRRPPVKGTTDPDFPGHVLVPVRAKAKGMPKANYTVPDTTYWLVGKRNFKVTGAITITPDGVKLGWDLCGACACNLNHCECNTGISLPHAIGYIFISRGGQKPLPQPNAVRFQPPVVPAPLPSSKPKRSLAAFRPKQSDPAERVADAHVKRALRRLK